MGIRWPFGWTAVSDDREWRPIHQLLMRLGREPSPASDRPYGSAPSLPPELSTVIEFDPAGIRVGCSGFGGEDGDDPRLNTSLPMGLHKICDSCDSPGY